MEKSASWTMGRWVFPDRWGDADGAAHWTGTGGEDPASLQGPSMQCGPPPCPSGAGACPWAAVLQPPLPSYSNLVSVLSSPL